jgi:hypothetical protein
LAAGGGFLSEAGMTLKAKLGPSQGVHFAVVSNPGTMFERVEDYAQNLKQAVECQGCYDAPVDVMKVLPNGELTTEF